MHIEVIGAAQQCAAFDFKGKTAIVIDVLRATSVIATALHHGAKAIIPAILSKKHKHFMLIFCPKRLIYVANAMPVLFPDFITETPRWLLVRKWCTIKHLYLQPPMALWRCAILLKQHKPLLPAFKCYSRG